MTAITSDYDDYGDSRGPSPKPGERAGHPSRQPRFDFRHCFAYACCHGWSKEAGSGRAGQHQSSPVFGSRAWTSAEPKLTATVHDNVNLAELIVAAVEGWRA
jgi:hypothetical protein